MTNGERIKEQRLRLGLSQTDVAHKIGVSKQTLYKYENDIVTNIPYDTLYSLSEVLEVSPAYILGLDVYEQAGRTLAAKLIDRRLNDACKKAFDFTEDDKQMVVDFINRLDSGRIIPD